MCLCGCATETGGLIYETPDPVEASQRLRGVSLLSMLVSLAGQNDKV